MAQGNQKKKKKRFASIRAHRVIKRMQKMIVPDDDNFMCVYSGLTRLRTI